jgi:hypothetical protein
VSAARRPRGSSAPVVLRRRREGGHQLAAPGTVGPPRAARSVDQGASLLRRARPGETSGPPDRGGQAAGELGICRDGRRGSKPAAAARQVEDCDDWMECCERKRATRRLPGYPDRGRRGQRMVADMTPAYALVSEERLRGDGRRRGRRAVLYLVRDPVERLWSHVRMIAAPGREGRQRRGPGGAYPVPRVPRARRPRSRRAGTMRARSARLARSGRSPASDGRRDRGDVHAARPRADLRLPRAR